jgi:putative transposase
MFFQKGHKMRKSYKFKLFQNKRKSSNLYRELWQFHLIYNHSLKLIKKHYKIFKKHPKKSDLEKHLKRLMDRGLRVKWKALGYSQGIQEVTDRIYLGFQAFFDWCKKGKKKGTGMRKSPPKFKPFRKYKSFTLKQAAWKLDEERGVVRIGKTQYKYNKSTNILGVAKTLTIKRDNVGDWFIIISCDLGNDFIPEKIASTTGKGTGFDFGLKSFLTSSDGKKHESHEYLKTHLKELKKKSRNLSKKDKGSKNRKKARKFLARYHRKIANKRLDFHFKLALDLIRSYDNLVFEDLNLQGMKKLWGRKVSDYGFSDFLKILENKAFEHRKNLYKIDRFFPSSKCCAKCGNLKNKDELKLQDRIYECSCGHRMDRDINAAINILKEGASSFGVDGVIPDFDLVSVA